MGAADAARGTQMCASATAGRVRYAVSIWSRCRLCGARAGDGHIDLRIAKWRLRATRDDDAGCFAPAHGAFQPHAPGGGPTEIMRMAAATLGDPTAARRNHFCSPVLSTIDRSFLGHMLEEKQRPDQRKHVQFCATARRLSRQRQASVAWTPKSRQNRTPGCVHGSRAGIVVDLGVTRGPARSVLALMAD